MKIKKKGITALLMSLALAVLLCGCAAVLGPQSEKAPSDTVASAQSTETADKLSTVPEKITVTTVDEFLAALNSHTEIYLEEGSYDLTAAADYGKSYSSGPYTWEPVYGGYQLVIRDLEGLNISGASPESAELVTLPRHACVLVFDNCAALTLSCFSAGHMEITTASCEGDVIELNACREASIYDCSLYGCGEVGVTALNSRSVFIENSRIYECSTAAVWVEASRDVRVTDCSIYDIKKFDSSIYRQTLEIPAAALFQVQASCGFAAVNCEIYNSRAYQLLNSSYSREVYFLGCDVENNQFVDSLFALQQYDITVDGCSISAAQFTELYSNKNDKGRAVSRDGTVIEQSALFEMQLEKANYCGPELSDIPATQAQTDEDGTIHISVETVDDFLSAIAPDTTIHLDGESFDLSSAAEYGSGRSDYYRWEIKGDGPELVISGVSNFHIVGSGKEQTMLTAVPRTANVLHFYGCENISVSGITAGHSAKSGVCEGGVLDFLYCSDVKIKHCGLFGCGILGVSAQDSRDMEITDSELYECSQGGAHFIDCENVSFSICDIHDCPSPYIVAEGNCRNFIYDGTEIQISRPVT